jgi:hypothetical protein
LSGLLKKGLVTILTILLFGAGCARNQSSNNSIPKEPNSESQELQTRIEERAVISKPIIKKGIRYNHFSQYKKEHFDLKISKIVFWVLSLIFAIVFFLGIMILLSFIQQKLFLPPDYIMWTSNYPISRLVFLFELYLIPLFFKQSFIVQLVRRHKKLFVFANLILIYALMLNVSVITNNSIINHTFLLPKGKVYHYTDIVRIDTGVYEKKQYLPFVNLFTHSKGEFYYILTLKDGITIDLNDVGRTIDDKDVYEVFEEIDKSLVDRGITKTSNVESFQYFDKNIAKVYADRIEHILTNLK